MEDRNKDKIRETDPDQKLETKEEEDGRELSEKQLDDIAGGTQPTINPW